MAGSVRLDIVKLIPQIMPGHRLWAEAADTEERFVALHDIKFRHGSRSGTMWLSLYLFADDLSRLGVTHKRFLEEAGLTGHFREVKYTSSVFRRPLMCLDSIRCPRYSGRPSDAVHRLVPWVKNRLWTTVASVSPYRRYYVYLAPQADRPQVLPQLLSIYAVIFYLGSITRYRPHLFNSILDGIYGARMLEFIDSQPMQFVYLMASEFAEREVTKPSIVG